MFGMILMGLLVFSFAIWGIADIFRGYGRQSLIRVGDICRITRARSMRPCAR